MDAKEVCHWSNLSRTPKLKPGSDGKTVNYNHELIRQHLVGHGFLTESEIEFSELGLKVRLKRDEFYSEREVVGLDAYIYRVHEILDDHPGKEYEADEDVLGYWGHIKYPEEGVDVKYDIVLIERGLKPDVRRKTLAHEHAHFLHNSMRERLIFEKHRIPQEGIHRIKEDKFCELCVKIAEGLYGHK